MPDSRLLKAVFYGELSEGKRKQGGQKLHFKEMLKWHLKNANIKSETWEQDALEMPVLSLKPANRMLWTEVSGEPLLNNQWKALKRSGS